MRVLKQSTAVTVLLGPFVDKTDGVTEEVGLATTGTEISKAGGAFGAGPVLGTHDSDGWYPISLTTTHTNTLGDLTIKGHDNATHLPVWMHFTVLPANSYDALVSGSGVGMRSDVQGWLGTAPATPTVNGVPEVDVTHVGGGAQSATDLKDFVDDGYDPATNKVQGLVLADAVTTVNGLAANSITAAAAAADFGTEIGTAVWASAARTLTALDEDATTLDLDATIRAAMGLATANLDTQLDALPTAAEIRDAVFAQVIEGAVTFLQSARLHNAALLGKASGLAGTTAVYRDLGDTKDRITATVDADGNRTAVTLDGS